MRKSIKTMVGIRVAFAFAAVLVYSLVVTFNIFLIKDAANSSSDASEMLNTIEKAEAAHYKWSSSLSSALYAGIEFDGSMDPTACVLGKWLYSDSDTDDAFVIKKRNEIEPMHKALHESAGYALELMKTDPEGARDYYQNTIRKDLAVLVANLEEIVAEGEKLTDESSESMFRTIHVVQIVAGICFFVALICLISLITYVMKRVIRPIMYISACVRPLQEGTLELNMDYESQDEIGELSAVLNNSLEVIQGYVGDINRIMNQLASGEFNVHTSAPFIGDFKSIETSIESFTDTLSASIGNIGKVEHQISGSAEQLSSGAQSLAQGATQQASAVEQLYAMLEELSKNAAKNVEAAQNAQENARLTGEQVTLSSRQMEEMISAMNDITQASHRIGEIIATIENIAFQTNILALNAAVEAARAGDAGKGFAVVADEVRSLAAQSDQAAKATKELIGNSVNVTEKGSHIVDEVSHTLQKTLDLVVESNGAIGSIAEVVRGEAESIKQVTDGIGQISEVVQTNSASSEESAAVSEELFAQVTMLRQQTEKFRLKK